jgi:hypothetical protein
MDRCPDIGFDSYDRFFPSQDTMPVGEFGNLIALPLQNRRRENGKSVLLDDNLRPYEDQWSFLSTIKRLSRATSGQIIGIRIPSINGQDDESWAALPSRRSKEQPIEGVCLDAVEVVLGN